MSATTPTPTAAADTPPQRTFLQIIDTQKSASLAARNGFAWSPEDTAWFDAAVTRHMGGNDYMDFIARFFSFLQNIPQLISGGMDLSTAWAAAAAEAPLSGTINRADFGLALLYNDMETRGGAMAASRDLVTGITNRIGPDRVIPRPDPDSLAAQIVAGRNLENVELPHQGNFNMNPAQQLAPLRYADASPAENPAPPQVPHAEGFVPQNART